MTDDDDDVTPEDTANAVQFFSEVNEFVVHAQSALNDDTTSKEVLVELLKASLALISPFFQTMQSYAEIEALTTNPDDH